MPYLALPCPALPGFCLPYLPMPSPDLGVCIPVPSLCHPLGPGSSCTPILAHQSSCFLRLSSTGEVRSWQGCGGCRLLLSVKLPSGRFLTCPTSYRSKPYKAAISADFLPPLSAYFLPPSLPLLVEDADTRFSLPVVDSLLPLSPSLSLLSFLFPVRRSSIRLSHQV